MMHWGDYGWGMGGGWLFMILFWALVVLGVVYLARMIGDRVKGEGTRETPLTILKKRYARGEITREDFERMKDELTKDQGAV